MFDEVTVDGTDCLLYEARVIFYELKNDSRWPHRAQQLVTENLIPFAGLLPEDDNELTTISGHIHIRSK